MIGRVVNGGFGGDTTSSDLTFLLPGVRLHLLGVVHVRPAGRSLLVEAHQIKAVLRKVHGALQDLYRRSVVSTANEAFGVYEPSPPLSVQGGDVDHQLLLQCAVPPALGTTREKNNQDRNDERTGQGTDRANPGALSKNPPGQTRSCSEPVLHRSRNTLRKIHSAAMSRVKTNSTQGSSQRSSCDSSMGI